jgi:hypothetical protein
MRLVLAGLLALAAPLMPSGAKAAMQVNCIWERRTPVAITVEGDGAFWREHDRGAYYDVEVNKLRVWLLLDQPRPALSIHLTQPDNPIGGWSTPAVVVVGSSIQFIAPIVCRPSSQSGSLLTKRPYATARRSLILHRRSASFITRMFSSSAPTALSSIRSSRPLRSPASSAR